MNYFTEEIIALRKEKKTYREIGRIVNLSGARVQQIILSKAPKLTGHGFIKRKPWAKMKSIACKTCGKRFEKYESVIRNSKFPVRYCSRKCYRSPKKGKRA